MKEIEKVVIQLPTKKPQAQMDSQNSSILLKTVNTQRYLKLLQKQEKLPMYFCKSITLIAKAKNNFIKKKL